MPLQPQPFSGPSSSASAFSPTTHTTSECRTIRNSSTHVPNSIPPKSDRLSSSLPLMNSNGIFCDVQAPQSPKLRPRTSVNEPPHLTLPASPLLSRSRLKRHLFRKDEVEVDMEECVVEPTPLPRTSADITLSSSAPHQSFMTGHLSSKATTSSTVAALPVAAHGLANMRSSVGVASPPLPVAVPTSKLLSPLTVTTSLSSPLQVSSQSPRLLSSLLLRQIPPPDLSSATTAALGSSAVSLAASPLQTPSSTIAHRRVVDQVHRTLASLSIHTSKAVVVSQSQSERDGTRNSISLGGALFNSVDELDRSANMDSDGWSDSDESDEAEHDPFCECCRDQQENGQRLEVESTALPQSSPSEERPSSHVPSSFFLSTSPSSNEEFSQSKSGLSAGFAEDQDHQAFDSDDADGSGGASRKFQVAANLHSPRSLPPSTQSNNERRKTVQKMDEQSFYNSTAFSSDDDTENDLGRRREPPTPNATNRPINRANANKNRFQPSRHSHLCRSARRRRNRKLRLKALKATALQAMESSKSDVLERMVNEKRKAVENDALQFNLTLTEEEEERMT